MILMERKELFREYGEHKLYFGMYLDDCGTVYEGYCIGDNELDGDYNLYNLVNAWNSLTGDNLDADNSIAKSFYNNMIIEFLSSKYKIDIVEGFTWEEIGIICLERLDFVDLLGAVGRMLLKHKDIFPVSISSLAEWLEGQVCVYQTMSTSSLVGPDDELAIKDWISSEEQFVMKELLSEDMFNFLIVVKEDYVIDVQIASNEYISDLCADKNVCSLDYDWKDAFGQLVLGMYSGKCLLDVLEYASIDHNIDRRALHGYVLA